MSRISRIWKGLVQPFRRLSDKLPWWVWSLILFFIGVLEYLGRRTVPAYPYDYDGKLFYPWLILYNNLLFHLVLFVFWLFALIRLLQQLKTRRTLLRIFTAVALLFGGIAMCTSSFLETLFTPGLNDIASTFFEGNVYHLTLSYGSSSDLDVILAVYMVYQCDSIGLICHLYYCPFFESVSFPESVPSYVSFSTDPSTNELYVRIGSEKSKVRPMCRYWGANAD